MICVLLLLLQIEGSSIKQIIEENIGKDFDFLAYADKVSTQIIKNVRYPCQLYRHHVLFL